MSVPTSKVARTTLVSVTLLAAVVAGIASGIALIRVAATSSPVAMNLVLDRDTLHALGMRAIILDVSNSDFVAELNRGPLEVTSDDVSRILRATFDEEDTSAKARDVHADLVHFIRAYPAERIFHVSIVDERPILTDSLGRLLLEQYAALPDCGVGADIGALLDAARVRFFDRTGDEFFSEDHPDCRPPEIVASRVEEGLAEEIEEMKATGPESVETFPDDEDDPAFAMLMERVNRVFGWTLPIWPLLLLGGALAGHPRRTAWRPVLSYGMGLLLCGVLAVSIVRSRIREAFIDAGTPGEASEVWGQLGSYALQRVFLFAGSASAVLGALIISASVVAAIRLRAPTKENIG